MRDIKTIKEFQVTATESRHRVKKKNGGNRSTLKIEISGKYLEKAGITLGEKLHVLITDAGILISKQ